MQRVPDLTINEILDNIPIVVWTAEPDGTVDYYNKGWEELTGITASSGLGTGWAVTIHPDDEEKTLKVWQHSVATGDLYEIEHRIKNNDGYKWVLSRGRAVKDKNGKIVKWYGTAIDISRRKKAEEELKIATKTYKLVGESLNYGVWRTTPEGEPEYISKSFLDLMGIGPDQIKTFNWGNFIDKSLQEEVKKRWKYWKKEEGSWEQEHVVKTKSGEEKVILSRGKPVYDNDILYCWAGINLDITELKNKERQLEKTVKEKELLLYELNHRVKNNLQLMTSLLNLQINISDNSEVKEELHLIKSRLSAVTILYDKLHELKSIGTIDLRFYITRLLDLLERLHKNVNIKLDVVCDSVSCSTRFAVNIGLIINEIVTNSFKYAFPDSRYGIISLKMKLNENNVLYLKVWDNGIGLPEGFEKIREESFGSEIINSLILQEEGKVNVYNDGGTVYEIEIPLPEDCKY